MKQRVITGAIMGLVLIPLLIFNELLYVYQILMMGLFLIGSNEMVNLYNKEKKTHIGIRILIITMSSLIYLAVFSYCVQGGYLLNDVKVVNSVVDFFNSNIGLVPAISICLLGFFAALVFVPNFGGEEIGHALTNICYTGVCFGALTALRYFGIGSLVYVLMVTTFTDIFAYFGGYLFGKHKMAPTISPKKTWEGAIVGSTVATVCATLFAYFYADMFGGVGSLFHQIRIFETDLGGWLLPCILLITLAISVCGQIGDLVASKLKRTYDIKDYGNLFPGHGGVMDRFDSALFAAIIVIIFILI